MIIAIDFDGTLCENEYPGIGKPRWGVIHEANKRKLQGDILILNTCRGGKLLTDAVQWCLANGLKFDCVNENTPEIIKKFSGDCRKISADEYWDDHNRRI